MTPAFLLRPVLPWLLFANLNSSGKTIKLPRLNFFLSDITR
jgi:hypothetical protein